MMMENNRKYARYYGLLGTMLVLLLASLVAAIGIMRYRVANGAQQDRFTPNASHIVRIDIDGLPRIVARATIPLSHQATAADANREAVEILHGYASKAGNPGWLTQINETHAGHYYYILRAIWSQLSAPNFVLMAATPQGNSVRVLIYHGVTPITLKDNAVFQQFAYQLSSDSPSGVH